MAGLCCQFTTFSGLLVSVYNGDIIQLINSDVSDVITSETEYIDSKDPIVQALLKNSPGFKVVQRKLTERTWRKMQDIKKTKMQTYDIFKKFNSHKFQYEFVFHAFVRNYDADWVEDMAKYYARIFDKAERNQCIKLVTTLLGSGRGGIDVSMAAEALVSGLSTYKTSLLNEIVLIPYTSEALETLVTWCSLLLIPVTDKADKDTSNAAKVNRPMLPTSSQPTRAKLPCPKSTVQAADCEPDMMSETPKIETIYGDITEVDADAVVTGEGTLMDRESGVTRALLKSFPQFGKTRKRLQLSARNIPLPLWTALDTRMPKPCRFKHVIHAIMDTDSHEHWVRHMRRLYKSICKLAESLNDVSTVAIPLLGTGTGKADKDLAVRALMTSVVAMSPKFKLVIKDPNLVHLVQCKAKEHIKRPNLLQRGIAYVADKIDQNAYRAWSPRQNVSHSDQDISHTLSIKVKYKGTSVGDPGRRYLPDDKDISPGFPAMSLTVIPNSNQRSLSSLLNIEDEPNSRDGPRREHGHQWQDVSFELQRAIQLSKEEAERIDKDNQSSEEEDDSSIYNASVYGSSVGVPSVDAVSDYRDSSYHLKGESDEGTMSEPKTLGRCHHASRRTRSYRYLGNSPCYNPVSGVTTGTQPEGQMLVKFINEILPGHGRNGTIVITYSFPDGIQGQEHPHPWRPYIGTTLRAYLPDSEEGAEVLRLLKISFHRRLTFTIRRSRCRTTGKGCVISCITHKTRSDYPDPLYLATVKEELMRIGVNESIGGGRQLYAKN